MIERVIFPQLEASLEKGTLVEWLAEEGEQVKKGRPLFEVNTDKANFTVEAPADGMLLKKIADEDEEVTVAQVVGLIGDESGSVEKELEKIQSEQKASEQKPVAAKKKQAVSGPVLRVGKTGRVRATPAARALAQEKGLDAARLRDECPEEVITAAWISRHYDADAPSWPAVERKELTPLAKNTARALEAHSRAVVPSWVEVDAVTPGLKQATMKLTDKLGAMVTPTDIVIHAAAGALRDFSILNARFENGAACEYTDINVAFAVERKGELHVPVLKNADRMSLKEIAVATKSFRMKVARKKLLPSESSDATFTVTELGSAGADHFVPVIGPGQGAVLGIAKSGPSPRADENGNLFAAFTIRLALTFDHRLTAGVTATSFLKTIEKKILELIHE